jgi:TrmH family RNA methyltransferase
MNPQIPGELPRLFEDVRRVATSKGRARVGAFVLEGRRMLERGLRAGWVPRAVLVGEREAERDRGVTALLLQLSGEGHPLYRVPDALLLELAEGRSSGLLTALFDLPSLLSVADLLGRRVAPSVYLVAVDVEEPGNVGALIRTALASDAAGLVCVGATDPFHPKAVRTSLGSLFKLPLARAGAGAGELFSELRAAQVHSLAAVARDGQPLHRGVWPSGSVAIVVGSESEGLSEHWREAADGRISIDFCRAADSFGVNAAAAICLYEVQRRLRGAEAVHA